jgi:hypothetical protein
MANYKRKSYSKEDQAISRAKVDATFQKIEDGIKNLWETDKYKNYLKVLSTFHTYSANNMMLIKMQMPSFTRVASYATWKQIGRQVLRGQNGIQILAGNKYSKKVITDKLDPQTRQPVRDEFGNIEKTETSINKLHFKLGNVFDISQTSGRELPTIAERLDGTGTKFETLFDAIEKTSLYPIVFEDTGRSGGYFRFNSTSIQGKESEAFIAINENLNKEHQVKTLIHELTHADLHSVNGDILKGIDSSLREVQAESVAYAVCEHFDIDSSQYSFGYIAGWAKDKELSELKSTMSTIKDKTCDFIEKIENEVEMIMEKTRCVRVDILKSNSELYTEGSTLPYDDFYELYLSEYGIVQTLENGVLKGEAVASVDMNNAPITVDLTKCYSCHFFTNTFDKDQLNVFNEKLGIESFKYDKDTVGYMNLEYNDFLALDEACHLNNSSLIVDIIDKNHSKFEGISNIDIKVSIPSGESIDLTLDASVDQVNRISQQFDILHDIDLENVNYVLNESKKDFAFSEVKNSGLDELRDGLYCDHLFQYEHAVETTLGDLQKTTATVDLHYRNKNGAYSPLNIATINLSKDFDTQIAKLIPNYEGLKTDFYKSTIKNSLLADHDLTKLSTASINIIGREILEFPNHDSAQIIESLETRKEIITRKRDDMINYSATTDHSLDIKFLNIKLDPLNVAIKELTPLCRESELNDKTNYFKDNIKNTNLNINTDKLSYKSLEIISGEIDKFAKADNEVLSDKSLVRSLKQLKANNFNVYHIANDLPEDKKYTTSKGKEEFEEYISKLSNDNDDLNSVLKKLKEQTIEPEPTIE